MLVASGVEAQMLLCYGGVGEDIVLRWAEVIPVWYLQKYITNGLCIAVRICSVHDCLTSLYASKLLCSFLQLLLVLF